MFTRLELPEPESLSPRVEVETGAGSGILAPAGQTRSSGTKLDPFPSKVRQRLELPTEYRELIS